jgi:hypothetical protein
MFFWIWTAYISVLGGLCALGITRDVGDGTAMGCQAFDTSRVVVHDIIQKPEYWQFFRFVSYSRSLLGDKMRYTWENMTVLVPDQEADSWKNMNIVKEFDNRTLRREDTFTRITEFTKHHVVERSIPKNKNVRTNGGNMIWWDQVGQFRYVYPGAIRVLNRTEAYNGEVWKIEKLLWSEIVKK